MLRLVVHSDGSARRPRVILAQRLRLESPPRNTGTFSLSGFRHATAVPSRRAICGKPQLLANVPERSSTIRPRHTCTIERLPRHALSSFESFICSSVKGVSASH